MSLAAESVLAVSHAVLDLVSASLAVVWSVVAVARVVLAVLHALSESSFLAAAGVTPLVATGQSLV